MAEERIVNRDIQLHLEAIRLVSRELDGPSVARGAEELPVVRAADSRWHVAPPRLAAAFDAAVRLCTMAESGQGNHAMLVFDAPRELLGLLRLRRRWAPAPVAAARPPWCCSRCGAANSANASFCTRCDKVKPLIGRRRGASNAVESAARAAAAEEWRAAREAVALALVRIMLTAPHAAAFGGSLAARPYGETELPPEADIDGLLDDISAGA